MIYGQWEIDEEYILRSVLPRITRKIKRDKRTGCDVWLAGRVDGYGVMAVGLIGVKVHRFLLIRKVGPLAPDIDAEHKCRNRACVRIHPEHVRPLSREENYRIGMANTPGAYAKRSATRRAAGWSPSLEVRARIRAKLKGRALSEETRLKMSASRTGKKFSAATKKKLSDAAIRREAKKRKVQYGKK